MGRNYSSTAIPTTLAVGVDAGATTLQVVSPSGYPSSTPYTVVIDPDTDLEEIVTVTTAVGNAWTVQRGQDGSSALAHAQGAAVRHKATARDFQESQDHIDATSGVHGLTSGAVVGTSQPQALTNKVMSGSSNSFSNIPQTSVVGLTSDISSLESDVSGLQSDVTELDGRVDTHAAAASGVHQMGASEIVGTNKSQTLQNKTIQNSSFSHVNAIACGTTSFTTNNQGDAAVNHNAGFTPDVIQFQHRGGGSARLVLVRATDANMTSTSVNVTMYSAGTGNPMTNTESGTVDWIAMRSA